jgi:hypothetical protein
MTDQLARVRDCPGAAPGRNLAPRFAPEMAEPIGFGCAARPAVRRPLGRR